MKPHGRAIRLGLFTLAGLALLVLMLVAVFGARIFAVQDRAVLRFANTVQGLQVGGPVVLRGVRIGTVRSIEIETNAATGQFEVPVVVDIDRNQLRDLNPDAALAPGRAGTLEGLVAHGLQGQLQLQSLLTGQLYVDLDMRTAKDGRPLQAQPVKRDDGMVEIPTRASRLQSLQQQLEGIDFGKVAADVSEVVRHARTLVGNPALAAAVDDIGKAAHAFERIGAQVERRIGPLADAAQGTLASAQGTLVQARTMAVKVSETTDRLKSASDRTGAAAERVGAAGQRLGDALAPDSRLMTSLVDTSAELQRAVRTLERAAAEDGQTLQSVDAALRDVARMSRAVRDLADALDRQPDALLRGRRVDAGTPDDPPVPRGRAPALRDDVPAPAAASR